MKDNNRIDTYINKTLHNGDVSSVIGMLKSNTLNQSNKSSKLNEMTMIVENGDFNDDDVYMNIYTVSVMTNNTSIDYK